MNILFIGSSGILSFTPLVELKNSNHTVCAIASNEVSNNEFSAITVGSLQAFSFDHSIPLINLNDDVSNVVAQIKTFKPDVILVSCYPALLPQAILSLAKKGAFNLHPSLLPEFRGPVPLFWQFREGVRDFGVTLHRMTSDFDAGNIVSQQKIKLPDGITLQEATKLIAIAGSQLILDFLDVLNENVVKETAQDVSMSSYQTFPTINDYRVETAWSAKRIYNFISAYKEPNVFFLCEIDGIDYKLVNALSYQANAYADMDVINYVEVNDTISFACGDGYIQCKIKRD